ncbi:MAG: hypothetical protein OXI88_06855 [Gammaproteobacteria bacterium]|nr:hypothetical protein [Gammaproteobacteria bacterium]MDE0285172.1 hypothetical protein [Gammaproteobacteria bacterium]MDE0511483.1 hypothetical protein [Gammaproteobacteria bacterium]
MARSIKSRGADSGPRRAFDLARELVMSDDEQVEARRELKDIHPGLFRIINARPATMAEMKTYESEN